MQPTPQAQDVPMPPPVPPRTAVGALPPPPPGGRPPARPPTWGPGLAAVLAVLVGVWIVGATYAVEAGGWLVIEVVMALTGLPPSGWAWVGVAWGTALLVALPAALLGLLTRSIAPQASGVLAASRAWWLAGVAAGVLGTARAVPTPHNVLLLLVTTLLAVALTLVIRKVRRGRSARHPSSGFGFGLAAGLLVLIPWAWFGALGGLLETALAVTAAVAFGWLAATLLDPAFFAGFARSRPWHVIVGGLAAGTALVPLAAGLGGSGVYVAEMLILPPLGFVAAAISASSPFPAHWYSYGPYRPTADAAGGSSRATVVALVGAAAAGPLAFVDPEETSILLGTEDIGFWTLMGSLLGIALALFVALVYGFALSPNRILHKWIPTAVAAVVGVAALGVYAGPGSPGLYNDRLFVILDEQADLSGLDAIADRSARLRATYERMVQHAERTQAPLRRTLDRYGLSYTPYYLVNAIAVDGGPVIRQWLAARDDVDRVLLDQVLRPLPSGPVTGRGTADAPDARTPQWNVAFVGADRVWRDLDADGSGIVVGSSDSGVDGRHPALSGGFRGGDDSWYDPWNGTAAPTDHNGHGTHTTGTAVGREGVGVAPGAQWIGCVNLDRNLGSPSHYLDCLQFMLAPFPTGGDPWRDGRPERAPHVLTNSWGCPEIEGCDSTALTQATAAIRAAGVYFVAAAGNTGPRCGSVRDTPAPYEDVLTVGAVDSRSAVADFSSRGPTDTGRPKPDVVAPGVDILSAWPGGTWAENLGTSMATPHVAGVVALMWSAQPRLIGDIDRTTEILTSTAKRLPAAPSACGGPANSAGAGLVDAYAAVQAARAL